MKEEAKEMKLADVFKEVTVQSEFETFWNDFGDEIEHFMGATVEIMQATAKEGEDFIDVDLSELSLGAYQYVLNWLKSEGFKVTEKREYKSDELKGMVSNVVISWADAKAGSNKHVETTKASSADGRSIDWSTLADVTGTVNTDYVYGTAMNNVCYASGTDGLLSAKIADCAVSASCLGAASHSGLW